MLVFFFFQAEDGIRDIGVTGVQTCALPILPAAGFRGINVTIPHKRAALALADAASPVAAAVGAANTLTFERSGAIHADNTDAPGGSWPSSAAASSTHRKPLRWWSTAPAWGCGKRTPRSRACRSGPIRSASEATWRTWSTA